MALQMSPSQFLKLKDGEMLSASYLMRTNSTTNIVKINYCIVFRSFSLAEQINLLFVCFCVVLLRKIATQMNGTSVVNVHCVLETKKTFFKQQNTFRRLKQLVPVPGKK